MLQLLLVLGTVAVPVVFFLLRHHKISVLFDLFGVVAVLLANISAGLSVLAIKQSNTEFTTHIHMVFMDPVFLASTGYIGLYAVYRLMRTTEQSWYKLLDRLKQPV
jgi:hypothetical protein